MDRSIIHLNVADFAVAVERTMDCRLKDRPIIIAPGGTGRAAVYDMSEEAYQAGIRKGMLLRRAAGLCRGVKTLPPHPDRYEQAMRDLFRRAVPYSPLIETGDADGHLFMDATGSRRLFGPPVDVAWRLCRQIKKDLGLNPIWSVASNKLVAKVATRIVKPSGEYIVAAGEEEPFLAPLPISLIPGIERGDLLRLREFNLTRASQITALGPQQLQVPFGTRSVLICQAARGIDPSPVLPVEKKPPPKVIADHEFGNDTNDLSVLENTLYTLVERVGVELRRRRQAAGRVAIILDYSDGMRCARQVAAKPATSNDFTLFKPARRALLLALKRRVRIRHMRLICDRPTFPPAQLELFAGEQSRNEKRDNLVTAIDRIRHCFGNDAIKVARTLAV